MARELPRLSIGEQISPDVAVSTGAGGAKAAALGAIAEAADSFGRNLQGLLEQDAYRRGERDAAADAASGNLAPRDNFTVAGRAYNQIAKDAMAGQRDAAMLEGIDQALADNPDNPAQLDIALQAVRGGLGKTGFADVDARLDALFATRRVAVMGRARQGLHQRMVEQARGNFITDAQTAETSLVQSAGQAALDPEGDQAVGAAIAGYVTSLARHGPKTAFTVAGVEIPADDSRDGLLGVDDITRQALQGVGAAKRARILSALDKAPDAASKARLAGDLRQRWAAGDPMFAGLDGPQAEQLFNAIDADVSRASVSERAAQAEAGQRARDLIEAGKYGGDVDLGELRALAIASGDVGLVAQADYVAQVGFAEPGAAKSLEFDGDASVGAGFEAAADFVIDEQEGGAILVPNDNGRGATRYGINQAAHPDLDVPNLTRPGAVKRYRRYWKSIDGDKLPPALALVAFDAAVNQGEARAAQWVAQSGGDVGKYLALRRAAYQDLAQDPGQAKNLPGWMARLEKVGARAARLQAFANVQEGFGSDPIKFALGTKTRPALADVPVLDAGAAFSEDPGQVAAWGQAIGRRRALGESLAKTYRVSPRMLTDGERQQYADHLAQDPAAGVALAAAAEGAIGADGARALLREIGAKAEEASLAIHVAELRMGGQRAFSGLVIDGLRLKAEGAQTTPMEKGEPSWDEVQGQYAPALTATPGLMPAARQAAELARLADLQRGKAAGAEFYLRSALGGTPVGKRWYGGPAKVNGRMTVLPSWLSIEHADEALEAMAGKWTAGGFAPVWANGEAMTPKDVARLQLVLTPSGRYGLVAPWNNAAVRGRDGRPFEVDLDGQRQFLASRLGDAVLGRR